MIKEITGEQPFSMLNNGFSVSPSAQDYTLQYSSNGVDYTSWDEIVPAGENLVVTGLPLLPMYFRLKGNNSTVKLNY